MEKPPRRNRPSHTQQAPVQPLFPKEQGWIGLGLLLILASFLLLALSIRFIPRVFPDPPEVLTLLPPACVSLQTSGVAVEVTDAGCVVRNATVGGSSAAVMTSAGELLHVPLAQVLHYRKTVLPKEWQPDILDVAWLVGLVLGSFVLVAVGLPMISSGKSKSLASARPTHGPDETGPSSE